MGLEVLERAHALVCADARDWAQGLGARHPRQYVLEAGQGAIAGHYGLALLGRLEQRPHAYVETLALLSTAIVRAGGTPPPPPKPPRKRTGPKVSTTPPSRAEVERRRALFAAALAKVQPLLALAAVAVEWGAAAV